MAASSAGSPKNLRPSRGVGGCLLCSALSFSIWGQRGQAQVGRRGGGGPGKVTLGPLLPHHPAFKFSAVKKQGGPRLCPCFARSFNPAFSSKHLVPFCPPLPPSFRTLGLFFFFFFFWLCFFFQAPDQNPPTPGTQTPAGTKKDSVTVKLSGNSLKTFVKMVSSHSSNLRSAFLRPGQVLLGSPGHLRLSHPNPGLSLSGDR